MRPDSTPPRKSGPCPRTRTTQKHRGQGLLLQKQRGFGLVAALFLIIVIAGAIAAMWRLSVTQTATSSLALQQARAYQAARAGLEWGIYQAVSTSVPKCTPSESFQIDGFAEFWVKVECDDVEEQEEGKELVFYTLISTAEYSSSDSPDYTYRRLQAVVERGTAEPNSGPVED